MSDESGLLNISDVSKTVDKICDRISLATIAVPHIHNYEDIYQFIYDFEMATNGLSSEQVILAANKVFVQSRPLGQVA